MLSIIIPTHNRLNMLEELLSSIEQQNYKDIEVIIVADACSDGTNEYLKHKPFPINWKYLINDISLNAGGSRRRGFLESQGEFVTFVDDDDYLIDNDFYIRVMNIFEKNPNLSIVAANSLDKYEDIGTFERKQINISGYIDNQKYLSGFQFKWSKPCPSFAVFRRSKLLDAGIETMYMVNDCPLYLRALLVGDIYIETNTVGVYRIHDKNISKTIGVDFIIENLKEKEYVYKELKKRKFRFDLSFWWYKMVRITVDYFMYSNPSDEDKRKVIKWCKSHIHKSLLLVTYLFLYDYIPVLQEVKVVKDKMFFFIKKAARKVLKINGKILNTIVLCFLKKRDVLVINAWMDLYGNIPKHLNLGDELNYYLLNKLTGKRIVNYRNMYYSKKVNFCCIGSIVDSLVNEYSIVWGAGVISETALMNNIPKKVCAVRGALTRKYLLDRGVDCPPVYGDPALLLPLVYHPQKSEKIYTIGIIPHITDLANENVCNLLSQSENVKLIKLCGYEHWYDIIDEINQCAFIISSSLHGIIISDAYNVPNVWVEFSDNVVGKGFKFRDYYSSVRTEIPLPVQIKETTTLSELLLYKNQWVPINIDLNKLLSSCPFSIKPQYISY